MRGGLTRIALRSIQATGLQRRSAGPALVVPRAVLHNLHPFHGHQGAAQHALDQGQEGLDLVARVDDLDDDRQVLRQAQDLGGVQVAGMSEAGDAAQHGSAGQPRLARLENDRLVERHMAVAVVLAAEDAQEG